MSARHMLVSICVLAASLLSAQDMAVTMLDLSSMVRDAHATGKKSLRLFPGRLHLDSQTVGISNLSGFTLEGMGNRSTIVGHTLRPILIFERCLDLVVRDLSFDYDPLPFTQAEITAVGYQGSVLEYRVLPGYPELDTPYLSTTALFFSRRHRGWIEGFQEAYYEENIPTAPDTGRLSGLRSPWVAPLAPTQGDRLVLPTRRAPAILLIDCTNVRFENITIYTAPSAGILFRRLEGSNALVHLSIRRGPKLQPRMEDRLLSTGSTGIVVGMGRGHLQLDQCRLSFAGGDGVHTLGSCFPVLEGEGWVFRVADPHGDLEPYQIDRRHPLVARGLAPWTWQSRGEAELIATVNDAPRAEDPRATVRLVFEKLMPGRLRLGDWVDFPDLNGGVLSVNQCFFSDLRGAGLRVGSRETEVRRCGFERLRDGALVAAAPYDRGEAGWTGGGVFVSNVLVGREQVDGSPHPLDPPFLNFTGPAGAMKLQHGPWRIQDNTVIPTGARLVATLPRESP
ncbi:MAG: hypothetical protein J0L75_15685 [Spirochaetes bacterium]|nr:hypothetical protein [Spirochaetota bacterium]